MSDPQRQFHERYELLARLSHGPSGAVWCGRDLLTGFGCAIRILEPGIAADPADGRDLLGVLGLVRQLAHPNIVVVDDVVTGEDCSALVMPLISGESLAVRLARLGALDPGEATALVAQLCDALCAAHATSLVHGRVKPSNLLLEPAADAQFTVKLTDFGMAALDIQGVIDAPTAAAALSAAQYRAPELAFATPATPAADLYAAGVVLYESLVGHPPFTGVDVEDIARLHREAPLPRVPGLPDAIWPLLTACLAKQPHLRPSAGVIASLLRDVAPGAAVRVEPVRETAAVPLLVEPQQFEMRWSTVDTAAATAAAVPARRSLRWTRRTGTVVTVGVTALVAGAIAGFVSGGAHSDLPVAGSIVGPVTGTTTGTLTTIAPSAGRDTASGSPTAFATSPVPSASPGTAAPVQKTTAAKFPPALSVSASAVATSSAAGGSSSGGGSKASAGALHAVGAGKCLDDPNYTTELRTQQQIWDCNGQANQTWTHTTSNQLTVTVGGTTLCLDAYNNQTAAGTKVQTWSCNGQVNQQWALNTNGTITGVQSGLCLDVTGASTADGALTELWICNGGSTQRWTLG